MPKNSTILRVDDKCRTCFSDNGSMIDIFTAELHPKIQELAESTSIDINDGENLPRKICHICLYKLELWWDFKKQFIYTNNLLLKHLKDDNDTLYHTELTNKRRHSDAKSDPDNNSIEEIIYNKKIKPNNDELTPSDNEKTQKITGETSKIDMATTSGGGDGCGESQIKLSPSFKSRGFSGRRTVEQRMASTQRYVARKRALLAATGENDSDTDSMSSDTTQITRIVQQKSRLRTNNNNINNIENEIERLRNLSKSLNDFKSINDNYNNDFETEIIEQEKDDDKDDDDNNKNLELNTHTIQSELVIDDATFLITSNLELTDKKSLDNNEIEMRKTTEDLIIKNENKNTDIIDAVELRRVINNDKNDKKNTIERCLNIEVIGTDSLALKQIQIQLDKYVMNDMKLKLINNNDGDNKMPNKYDSLNKCELIKSNEKLLAKDSSFQMLEQQLKTVVEKAIKKNLESSEMRQVPISKISIFNNRSGGNKIFSPAFIKAAMKSQLFQPKVVLNRVESSSSSSSLTSNNNNQNTYSNDELCELNDNNSTNNNTIMDKVLNTSKIISIRQKNPSMTMTVTKITTKTIDNNVKNYSITDKKLNDGGNYVCSVCNEYFSTTIDIEEHINTNHVNKHLNKEKTKANIISKCKMMRCKCCHEIVDARYVKIHICQRKKTFVCKICKLTFKNDYSLKCHMKIHDNPINAMNNDKQNDNEVKEVIEERAMMDEVKIQRIENKLQLNESKVSSTNEIDMKINFNTKSNDVKNNKIDDDKINSNDKTTKIYTCFVCDKIFTDDEILKDHLQKHCDDISDDDKRNKNNNELQDVQGDEEAKEEQLYQCAICGDICDNETMLGCHVEKHLFDDKKINDKKKIYDDLNDKIELHTCVECNAEFDNEINLALHVQGHEEEIAIAEWEKNEMKKLNYGCGFNHTCTICEDIFKNEEDLARHIDIHNESMHICLLCDKPFLTLGELQDHVNTH